MSTSCGVSGCVGLCRVAFVRPTQVKATVVAGFAGAVSCVSGLRARARVCMQLVKGRVKGCVLFLREAQKTQQTRHTQHSFIEAFVFIGFFVCWVCVGLSVFVSGSVSGVLA
jgi:hypothetical protein